MNYFKMPLRIEQSDESDNPHECDWEIYDADDDLVCGKIMMFDTAETIKQALERRPPMD